MPLRKEYVYAFLCLAFLFALQAIGVVAHQMYGQGQINYLRDLMAFLTAIAGTALCLDVVALRAVKTGRTFTPPPLALFLLLLLPVVISIITVILRRMGFNSPFSDFVRAMAWAAYLPLCLHFFSSRLPASRQVFFLPLSMGLGHFCWVVLTPLLAASIAGHEEADAAVRQQYQIMLNFLCIFLAVGIATFMYRLMRSGVELRKPSLLSLPHSFQHIRRFILFLVPLAGVTFLNGLTGNLISVRLQTNGQYPGLIHLILLAFFCFCSAMAYRGKTLPLKQLLYFLCFLLLGLPLFLFISADTFLFQAWLVLCAVGHQALLFTALLIGLAFAPHSRFSASVTCSVFVLAGVANLGGEAFARFLVPLLPLPSAACVCSAACLALFPLLSKAFPLPTPDNDFELLPSNGTEHPHLTVLTPQEKAMLENAVQGMNNKEIAQDMGLAVSTVNNGMSRIYTKLEVKNRIEATRLWQKLAKEEI